MSSDLIDAVVRCQTYHVGCPVDEAGVGKTHLGIALDRAAVEHGHSVLFVTAAALLGALARAEADGQLNDRLAFFAKPKLLVIDELTCAEVAKLKIVAPAGQPGRGDRAADRRRRRGRRASRNRR